MPQRKPTDSPDKVAYRCRGKALTGNREFFAYVNASNCSSDEDLRAHACLTGLAARDSRPLLISAVAGHSVAACNMRNP